MVDLLAAACEPGLVAMPSGRFYGFVIGGTQPAALAADWLVSAWDQNTILRKVTPGVAAVEETAASWFLDLLGLPSEAESASSPARRWPTSRVSRQRVTPCCARRAGTSIAGWRAHRRCGCWPDGSRTRRPPSRCATWGCPRPLSWTPTTRAGSGRRASRAPWTRGPAARPTPPTIVLLQAGNLHSGAFDPFDQCVSMAHEHGAWVHVDGAFGLWAGASPSTGT